MKNHYWLTPDGALDLQRKFTKDLQLENVDLEHPEEWENYTSVDCTDTFVYTNLVKASGRKFVLISSYCVVEVRE